MYELDHLRRVGWINIAGSIVIGLAGTLAQWTVGLGFDRVAPNNLLSFFMFGLGWFLFSQLVMATIHNKIADASKRVGLIRLDSPLRDFPPRRWGQSYLRFEIGLLAVWFFCIVALQLALGANLTLPLGGLAGGWLVGAGAGRLRFARKLQQLEADQDSNFYFSDANLGPRTEIAYYTSRPVNPTVVEAVASNATSLDATLPGVKRRAVAATTSAKIRPAEANRKAPHSNSEQAK